MSEKVDFIKYELSKKFTGSYKGDEVGFICLPCQFLTAKLIRYIRETATKYKKFAIGVYTDQMIEELIGKKVIIDFDDRRVLANAIKGVDFVFTVPTLDLGVIESKIKEAAKQHEEKADLKSSKRIKNKKYKVGYVPGTYDLLHAGHIENLLIAREECEILVAGVNDLTAITGKSAESIVMSTEDRAEILEGLKIVDHVFIAKSSNKTEADNWIKQNVFEEGMTALYAGSDRNNGNYGAGFKTVFTERPADKMKQRSSTTTRKKLEIYGYTSPSNQTFTRTVRKTKTSQIEIEKEK